MAQGNFLSCLGILLGIEKGYVVDNGGPTNLGVTQTTLSAYLGRPATLAEVQGLDRPTAQRIYQLMYWDKVQADKLRSGVDLCVFDAAVNSGPGQATKWLQRAVGAVDDGVMGAITLTAVQAANDYDVVLNFATQRARFMLSLNNKVEEDSERGWMARVLKVSQLATLMVAERHAISLPDAAKG